jgi:D-alanyl-D-alanine carboxypeptidase/D-alanyl-D-alanine-endopeptidase (penicillin-binding protein 4)
MPVLFLGTACATFPGGGRPSLRERVEAIIESPPLDQVHWGISVVEAEGGRVLYERGAHRKFVPASNMKILSTASALTLLGSDFRYETSLWGVGHLERPEGVFHGDLVLETWGDPTLSDRFYPSPTAPLDSLADGLWAAGVRWVTGTLVVDVSPWDSTTVPGGWMVGNLAGTSAATGGAFAIGEGELRVEVVAGPREGDPVALRWWPRTEEEFFGAAFVTTHPDSSARRSVHYLPESRRLRLEGQIPAGTTDTVGISQRDPVQLASWALLRALEDRGISVERGMRVAWETGEAVGPAGCMTGHELTSDGQRRYGLSSCAGAIRLASLASPPLSEIVEAILEPSQNWMAEQLVHTLGFRKGEKGSWREGFRIENEFFGRELGVDSLDLSLRDGSGLAAYNLVTPRALVRILSYMRGSPHSELYRMALAEPGEEEGTLRRRLPRLEGRLFAKTGTITHVNSLSGYLVTEGGRDVIFSILTNGSGLPSSQVRAAIDRVVEEVARR